MVKVIIVKENRAMENIEIACVYGSDLFMKYKKIKF